MAEGTLTPVGDLVLILQGQLGFVALALGLVAGAVGLLSPDRWTRALAGQLVVAAGALSGAVAVGLLDPRIARYFVPLLAALGPASVVGGAAVARHWRPERATAGAAAVCLLIALPGLLEARRVTAEAVYPPGLHTAAVWLAWHGGPDRVTTNRWAPETSLLARLPVWRFQDLQTPENGFPGADPAAAQVMRFGSKLIMTAGSEDAGIRALESISTDLELRFARGEVRIWGPPRPAWSAAEALTWSEPGVQTEEAILCVAVDVDLDGSDFAAGLTLALEEAADPSDPRRPCGWFEPTPAGRSSTSPRRWRAAAPRVRAPSWGRGARNWPCP